MKAFGILGILIAVALSTLYMWDTSAPVAPDGAFTAEDLPAVATDVVEQANAQVAALQEAVREDEERAR